MDHIVYLDFKSNELENLMNSTKDIILRGATGRKLPYGRCEEGDILYFVNNNGEGLIKAKAIVRGVEFTDKLTTEESEIKVDSILDRVKLDEKALKRFRGKRYLSIIVVQEVTEVEPFEFDKTDFSNMDDWLPVEDINKIKI